jgi:hypothetical protein
MKKLIAGFIFVFFLPFESVAKINIENIPLAKLSNDDILKMIEPGYIKRKIHR